MTTPLLEVIESDFAYILAKNLSPLGAYSLDRLLELNKVAGGTAEEIEAALSQFVEQLEVTSTDSVSVPDDSIYL